MAIPNLALRLYFFICSTQLSMNFQLLIKTKMLKKMEDIFCFHTLRCCIYHAIMLIIVKMLGILTFTSMLNFMLKELSMKEIYNLKARPLN